MFNWFKKVIATESRSAAVEEAKAQRRGADHKNRGDDCRKAGAFDVAAGHYRQAIAAFPNFAGAHSALGDTLREQGKHDEAIICYRRALEFDAELVDAHYGLGVILLENKADLQNAAACFETTLRLKPDFIRANTALGFTFMQSGRTAEAIACFQKTIRFEPDNGMALHMIASLTGSNPPHPPSQYVEKLFDGFANTFDAHLRSLQYETPNDLVTLLLQRAAPGQRKWNILDLGCGTGLVGLAVAPYANQLVGVDLSAKMLEKARVRNLYHRLEHLDLTSMMANEISSSYDLVISADTFIYVGKLDDVVREVKRLLRPGGFFAFSVEALEASLTVAARQGVKLEYQLQKNPSCRYAHSSEYISRLAFDNNLKLCALKTAHVRKSQGTSIHGYLVLLESESA